MEIKKVIVTQRFERDLKIVKDSLTKLKIEKQIKKIIHDPMIGKPLRYNLKGERSVYIKPFRLIYSIENNTLVLLRFEHRKKAYR